MQLRDTLIGMYLFTMVDGQIAGGRVLSAVVVPMDSTCPAGAPGDVWVRTVPEHGRCLCFVADSTGEQLAVCIAALEPSHGEELMLLRLGAHRMTSQLTASPDSVCRALGLSVAITTLADDNSIWLERR